jgi:aminopeptidase N
MPALTESEAQARAALLTIDSCDVSIDLTATQARSRTVIRFRCARPGAESFADLTAQLRDGAAVLNGAPPGPSADGRLTLAGLAAENVLAVDEKVHVVRDGALGPVDRHGHLGHRGGPLEQQDRHNRTILGF